VSGPSSPAQQGHSRDVTEPTVREVRTRAVMRSFPGHVEAGCIACPHPVFESYYADTGEPAHRAPAGEGGESGPVRPLRVEGLAVQNVAAQAWRRPQ
jgi:hypothetical protein